MRKVWVLTLDQDLKEGSEIMIEQFDEKPPSLAFRAASWHTWGPPKHAEQRDG